VVLAAASLFACGSDDGATAEAPIATAGEAEALAREFLTLLQRKDITGLQGYLDDSFILQRADGSFIVKDDYLKNLPEIGPFTIANLTHKQTGSALVVRWELAIVQTINGQQYRDTPAPRLSTFVYVDGRWRMMSHANYNVPAEAPPASSAN
jgi:hypothetical protein